MPDELRIFFQSYLSAWNTANPEHLADHYAIPAGISTHQGCEVFTTRPALIEKLSRDCNELAALGYSSAMFAYKNHVGINPDHYFVDLNWTIHRHTDAPQEFGASYILRRGPARWHIFNTVIYESQPTMR